MLYINNIIEEKNKVLNDCNLKVYMVLTKYYFSDHLFSSCK